ncbi:thermonuclease family protein [Cellvibrio fontiphilus]|uniref:Thermonuclease family protein n=1 Tax=Cellvibrio fontiphilus TaxID=1815559 RepID=A0ABV7FIX2_9GAMM
MSVSLIAKVLKTPGMKIPGVFLCAFFSFSSAADCGYPAGAFYEVAKVADGDTIKLADGRSVRVLGINAPEIAHGKSAAQPLGRESRAAAQVFVRQAGGRVRLGFEREKSDRYGRLLAHVYDSNGRSLAVELLKQGMALQISVPPNVTQEACLLSVERRAQVQRLGVWRNRYWNAFPVESLKPGDEGFRYLRGRVVRVDVNSSVWLELDGNLVAQISKRDWAGFGYSKQQWLKLKGQHIQLRGWVRARNVTRSGKTHNFKPLVVQLRSPAALQVSAADTKD